MFDQRLGQQLIQFVRDYYRTNEPIPLHAPRFGDREEQYVLDTLETTFVSSVGAYVDRFEQDVANYTNSPGAVATVNGTSALHVALRLVGVTEGDLVLTQPLTFVATCNAINYCGASPVFIDVERSTLGMSAMSLSGWLEEFAFIDDEGRCLLSATRQKISACVPMHTFGHPVDLDGISVVCGRWNIPMVEDAAESLGSLYHGRHTGTIGVAGVLSFNGNKIITTGGGGMLLCAPVLAKKAKHLTTTAKLPHQYEYFHDEVGFNYRMPNLNAALGCAQLERLEMFVAAKRQLADHYKVLFKGTDLEFVSEPIGCRSNYWLNAVICPDASCCKQLLGQINSCKIMVRPVWKLMTCLPMYRNALTAPLPIAESISTTLINFPSGVRNEDVS